MDFINTTMKKSKEKKLPKGLLTEEDIKKLVKNANNPRYKPFISLLGEIGARSGELIDLTVWISTTTTTVYR